MLYGTITEFCTEKTCPVMNAGAKFEYLWADNNMKKPIKCLPITDIIARVSINTIVVMANTRRIHAAIPPSVIWKLSDRSFLPKRR